MSVIPTEFGAGQHNMRLLLQAPAELCEPVDIPSEVWAHQDLLHLAEGARGMLGVPLLCVRVVLVRTVCWPRSARSLAQALLRINIYAL